METSKGGYLFIINPISGRGKALKCDKMIRSYCKKRAIRFSIHKTRQAGEASEITRKGMACGFEAIIAVGGDGTVNEVGKELIGSEIPLGIIPTGSGNGLARHMGIPMNIRRALSRIFNGNNALIDTGKIDENVFLNVAGIGFDAEVSKTFAQSDQRGWFNYLRAILEIGGKAEEFEVGLKSFKEEQQISCVMVSFANSAQYGNGAKIAPKADIADGKIDVCVLKQIGLFQKIAFFAKLMTGALRSSSNFSIFQSDGLLVKGGNGLAHADGDPIEVPEEFKVEVRPKSLYIIC